MNQQDLRASALIAAVWLLGAMIYSIWWQPAMGSVDRGVYNAFGPMPVTDIFADEHAPKHNRVPVRWAHQRWGAV